MTDMSRHQNKQTGRCDGMHRRDFLQAGCLNALGLGAFSLPRRLRGDGQGRPPRAKSCILIWLDGGPSHLEMWDPKPQASEEVRGPFRAIGTNVPGIHISELLSQTAQQADKLAIVRSVTSPLGEHGLANQYLLSGYKPTPVLDYPSYGAVLARLRAGNSVLPANIAIPEIGAAGAGFLGSSFQPFSTGGDPSKADFQVNDLNFFPSVDESRLQRRRQFLAEFEAAQRKVEEGGAAPEDPVFDQAFRLMTSPGAKSAFDLSQEPEQVRARYGPQMFGQSCLLARRLVERGVPFVSVHNTGWDTHDDLILRLKLGYSGARVGVGLLPTFDQGFSALLADLSQRGLLEDTLVIAMGEFGRTPKLNPQGGRDHWPRVFSVVLAGGGVPGGQVIGASDRVGESPSDNPVTPNDLARTIYSLLGVDPDHEFRTPDGRPVPVNQGGRRVPELVPA